jgi:hypothetical protein
MEMTTVCSLFEPDVFARGFGRDLIRNLFWAET